MNKIMTLIARRLLLFRTLSGAGGPLVASLALVQLAAALVPAAVAVVLAALVARVGLADGDLGGAAVLPLVLFGAVLIIGHCAETVVEPLRYLAVSRIDGKHRRKISDLAASSPTIDALERPDVQAMIREVEADPRTGYERTPGEGAVAQVEWFCGLLGVAASAAVLAQFAWWLVPLIVLPAAVNRMLRNKQSFVVTRHWQTAVAGELHADVWRDATVSVSAGKDTRVFGLTDWMLQQMQDRIAKANGPLWRYINRLLVDEWSQFLLVAIGLVPAYIAVTFGVLNGTTTIAVQTAILSAGAAVYHALSMSGVMHKMTGAMAALETTQRLEGVLSPGANPAQPSDVTAALATDMDRADVQAEGTVPEVSFKQIGFTYPGSEQPVFDGLDLDIRPGEMLAIVGVNGAGKSTLIKLLSGLYVPTVGSITVDGRDLATISPHEWRGRLSVVFQDFIRYHLTAAENVAVSPKEQGSAAFTAAVRDSGLQEVVDRLPAGWDTPLARSRTDGVDLSGGQWQQVALARALHAVGSGAGLLVLDEPTAHLDVQTEADVFGRLSAYRGRVSIVLISHRLATVRQADRIVLLRDGRIAEAGSHEELMAIGGTYAEMFTIQAERFARGYDDRIEEGELL